MATLFEDQISNQDLFHLLFNARTESDVDNVIAYHPQIFKDENWAPLGGDESTFGVIENQQASPIPALIEKVTNSIDAILMRKCYEFGIDPTSKEAPKTMEEALEKFFPNHKQWDLHSFRGKQAENIQILADGPKGETSLIIYDDGEGQHPQYFPDTFLSLLRGNKNKIKFVQGKYNMGGSGAIIFCGKKRYHLVASKRYDKTGEFGFSLIRKHPLSDEEKETRKNTWYEYLIINNQIPSFNIDKLDIGLYNRKFETGTILKLYSYDLPAGSRSVISRDLNQSINEYLFEPALPLYTVDNKKRYPDDRNLERSLYGLKRRLEENKDKYIEEIIYDTYSNKKIGELKITAYLFKSKVEGKSVKETKETIQREFFKNNMAVLFSVNGQVHGHLTSEFITRTLKMQLIKNYLLIHVDCTGLNVDLRNELFMASRDRLKQGEDTSQLRKIIADTLLKSKLIDLYKRRKDSFSSIESQDKNELLKSLTKNLPLKSDILNLLNQTFKLEEKGEKKDNKQKKTKKKETEEKFDPKRYPSYFKYGKDGTGESTVVKVPLDGERTLKFKTDVEDEYFVRTEDPGDLRIGLLNSQNNTEDSGHKKGKPRKVEDAFNIIKSSPEKGIIKVVFNPTEEVNVGDFHQIKVTLVNSGGEDFDQVFWVKISDPDKQKEKPKKKKEEDEEKIGLPELKLVYEKELEDGEERLTWEKVSDQSIPIEDHTSVVYPLAEGEELKEIYINMDSSVLKSYKSNLKSEEQYESSEKRYYTAVYFHTLFLFTINKKMGYSFSKADEKDGDLADYIMDLFESYYAQFLLNFGMEQLVESLEG